LRSANATAPRFFKTAAAFRRWLESNHDRADEILVGFYKVGSGKPSMTWPESVDQALAFGWIDGVRKRIDDISYSIRFTPRRRGSIWSAINVRRVTELAKLGLMHSAGLRTFEKRDAKKSAIYSYESAPKTLAPAFERTFRANPAAWRYFNEQRPSYRRVAIHWVMSAKKEETRERRLATLIEDSANGLWIRVATLERR
jgi:uncharacterized protein YdeI (YjbR/CyaY-like superfamily)